MTAQRPKRRLQSIRPPLWQAYERAVYRVQAPNEAEILLTVGGPTTELANAWPGGGAAFFITAHNPRSKRLTARQNAARANALLADITTCGLRFWPAVGEDLAGHWPDESGVLLFDVTMRRAVNIAAKFEQNAILLVPQSGLVKCIAV